MEPWEALDVDDSDIPSLLRPCKHPNHRQQHQHQHHRHQQQQQQTDDHNHSPSQPQHSHHQITVPNFSLLLPSQRQAQTQLKPPPCANSTSPRIIPGPAGAVQVAMLRKALANQNPAAATGGIEGSDNARITDQEYIRRVVEAGEDDNDFNGNPWLSALELLDQQEMIDGGSSRTPLNSIKKIRNYGRVDQVVAILKSCTPNGLGDLVATLKDPTGTIDASIHHKVLADVELGKDISVGSVLILQKVAVFSPSESTHYLNITLSNVAKVISKDTGPLIKQNHLAWTIKPDVLCREGGEDTSNIHKVISLELDRTEGVVDDVRQYVSVRNPAQISKLTERGDPIKLSGHCSNQNGTLGAVEIMKKRARIDCIDDDQRCLEYANKLQTGGYQPSMLVESQNEPRILTSNGSQKQRQAMVSKASTTEWTDEQLNELFATESEDGGSLF